jgi:RNA:NAD 2'-phosphotransferase (TPT1/KptA family)
VLICSWVHVYVSNVYIVCIVCSSCSFVCTCEDGFMFVDEMLGLPQLKRFTEDDVKQVVETNDKQRFKLELDVDTQRLKIRANQGHSVAVRNTLISVTGAFALC